MCVCAPFQTTLLNDVLERDPESVRALIDEMNEIKADLENEMVREYVCVR